MKHIEYLEEQIEELPYGYVFTHNDFEENPGTEQAVERYLNRLAKSGKINKLAKDKFYKADGAPQLKPYEVVKDLLFEEGKQIGYLTGKSSYNELGFNLPAGTQIEVGIAEKRNPIKRGPFKVSFIRQKNVIKPVHIPYFQLLDMLGALSKQAFATPDELCYHITKGLIHFSSREHKTVAQLALNYQARTRALAGALLQKIGYVSHQTLDELKASISSYTSFSYPISAKNLPHAQEWKIICA